MNQTTRYSEAFKKQVVDQIAGGKFPSVYHAQKAYQIGGAQTVYKWIKKYGRDDLLPKRIRIQTMKELDLLKTARKRIKELEAALADAHIDHCLEHSFLEMACERMDVPVEEFKKKHALTLSDVRRKQGLK